VERRAFIALVGGSTFAASVASDAEESARRYRIGVLLAFPATAVAPHIEALREGLRELGYLEQQNLVLEVRGVTTAQGLAGLDRLAADLVRSKADVLVASSTPATLAAKRATSTIPIVMIAVGDPVGYGVVASLARPGGNVTGVGNVARDITGKQMQLLKEVRPEATRIAVLRNSANSVTAPLWREAQAAGESLRLQLQRVEVREPRELEAARRYETQPCGRHRHPR
jgi:putative tryptophan/tyrosine transport system substrate-binding protein